VGGLLVVVVVVYFLFLTLHCTAFVLPFLVLNMDYQKYQLVDMG